MKHKEILIPMKYTGPIPCRIIGLGEFKPGEVRDVPERFADLQHDRNWKRLNSPEKKTESAAVLKKPSSDKK